MKCTTITDPNDPGGGDPGDTNPDGGGGGTGTDPGENDPETNPCKGNGPSVPNGPQNPNTGFRQSCLGVPTAVNAVATSFNTPCAKTKTLIQKPEVKTKLDQLYEKAKSTAGGEIAFMMKKDGTPGNIIQGGGHSVTLNDIDQHTGAYHNHTNKKGEEGIKMVSPKDIHRLFQFVTLQDAGTTTSDAFVGMIGAELCAVANDCRPDGYEMFNYVIRFSGTKQEAQAVYNISYNFIDLMNDYKKFENEARNKSGNTSQYGNYIGNKGLEKLFFYTLGNMGIDKNQMILQRIDKNGNITNITQGADGKPEGTACL